MNFELHRDRNLCNIIDSVLKSKLSSKEKLELIHQITELRNKEDFDLEIIFDIGQKMGLQMDVVFKENF